MYKSIYLLTYLLTITTHETVDGLPAAEYTHTHTSDAMHSWLSKY